MAGVHFAMLVLSLPRSRVVDVAPGPATRSLSLGLIGNEDIRQRSRFVTKDVITR
jgi:hypothetical protein